MVLGRLWLVSGLAFLLSIPVAEGISLGQKKIGSVQRGAELYKAKQCAACHTVDGSKGIGPTFKGLYNSKRTLEDGKEVVADDDYLYESTADPGAKTVKGYSSAAMVAINPPGSLKEQEVLDLVAYIKSIK